MAARARLGLAAFPAACLVGATAEGRPPNGHDEHIMDICVSVTLMGSVAFMMGLFYLTNNKDPRKAADSWKVISATISIFSAVLIFQCINGVLSAVLLWTGASDSLSLGISFAHMLVWMFCLHICLAWIASKLRDAHQDDVGQVQAAELNMKCFAVLLGHTTGFAAIRAFALGQHMVPGGALQKLIIVPLSWIALFLLDALCDKVRNAAIMADGKVSWFEHVWNNLVEEYEDDIIGLTSAFLIVQTFRLWLTGSLPNEEGEYEDDVSYSDLYVACLLLCGISFGIVEGARLMLIPVTFGRFTAQLQRVTAMIVGWSLFYSADGLVTVHFPYMVGVIKRVVVALGVTLLSMACIFAMGDAEETFIKYSFKTEKESTLVGGARPQLKDNFKEIFKFLRSTERGMATLIGFAWEQLFDLAVVSISHADSASQVVPPCVTKLLLALVLAGMVIPSWRLYILPLTAPLTDSLEEEDDKEWEDAHLQHNPSQTESLLRRLTIEDAVDVRLVPRLSRRTTTPGDERGPPARRASRASGGGGGGLGAPLLADAGGAAAGRDGGLGGGAFASHRARAAELARQLAESDAELDASLERLGELEQRSAALLACQAPG